ncbi:MAG: hypothetical protein ACXVJW_00155 [Acidimicrobiia bacterium]
MDRRTRLASIAAISATFLTGGLCAAATTGALTAANASNAGHVPLVADVQPASSVENPASGEDTAGSAGAATGTGTRSDGREAPSANAATTTPGPGSEAPEAPESSSVDEHADEPHTTTTTGSTPPPTVQPPPTTTGINCHGSDDGMTEAQKQAREAACHRADD